MAPLGSNEMERMNVHDIASVSSPDIERKEKTRRNVMIAGIVVVLVAVGVSVGLLMSSKNDSDVPSAAGSADGSNSNSSTQATRNGPIEPTAEVDEPIQQENKNQLGNFLKGMYEQLEITDWNTRLMGDDSSPQAKALKWVTGQEEFSSYASTTRIQRFALATFYYATYFQDHEFLNDPPQDWTSSTGWITDLPECQWEGIVCNTNGQVTAIQLSEHYLTGSLPLELGMLESLEELDLTTNYIYMENAALDVFLHMPKLRELKMEDNFVLTETGLPTQFGALTSIEKIQMSYNLLQGQMEGSIFTNLVNLQHLEVESNYLSGAIPSEIGKLPKLIYFYIRRNILEFRLEDVLVAGSYPALFSLWLDNNDVKGPIPTTLGLMTELASFSVTNATLTGNIPTEIGLLTGLKRVWLYDNELSGPIPPQIGEFLTLLEVFEVHDNNLSGTMPQGVCTSMAKSDYEFKTLTADCDRVTCGCCDICYTG